MADSNPTTKFKIDISDLKKNITEANRQVKLYRAELANASAGMAKGEETAESLTKKIEAQSKIVEAEKKKLAALKEELQRYEKQLDSGEKEIAELTKKHEQAAKQFGEDSKEAKALAKQLDAAKAAQERNGKAADDLRVKIIQQDTAVKNAEAQVNSFSQSLDDLQKEEKQTGDEAEKSTSGGLQSFAVALGNLAANVITEAIKKLGELGKAALAASEDFETGRDALVRATGAVGDSADEIEAAYAKTAKSIAGDMATIGNVVGQVNTYFGFLSDDLSTTSTDFLRFSDITGTDASAAVQKVSRILKASGEDLENYGDLLDVVAKASQASGISADSLLTSLDANGATLRAMNYSLEDSVAMLAKFELEGVNSTAVVSGLKKATVSWQKDGKDVNTELAATIHLISSAKDETEAAQIATETFGKGGTEMADAIRRGALDFSDFADILKDSSGTVVETYEEMQHGTDKINLAMQGLKVSAGQAMSSLVEEFGGGVENILNLVSDLLAGDESALGKLSGAISALVGDALQKAVQALPGAIDFAVDLAASLADAIIDAFPAVLEAVVTAATRAFQKITAFIVKAVQKLADFLTTNLDPLLYAAGDLVAVIISTLLDPATLAGLVDAAVKIVTAIADALAGDGMLHLLEAANELGTALVKVLTSPEVLASLAEAGTKILTAVVKAIVVLTPALVSLLLELIDSIGKTLASADWEAIGMSIIEAVLSGFESVSLDGIEEQWLELGDTLSSIMEDFGEASAIVWESVQETWSNATEFFKKLFEDAVAKIKQVFGKIVGYFSGIFDSIKTTFASIGETIVESILSGAESVNISAVWQAFEDAGANIEAAFWNVGDFAASIWSGIVKTWQQASGFFRTQFTDAYNAIKNVFANIGSFFVGIWDRLKSTFSGLGTKVGNAIGGAFKSAMNSVLATVERNLNSIPNAVNRALDVINQIPGVNIGHMGGISLPRLAQGAIIDKPTIAQIGEAGKEAVIPLERNKQGLREIAGLLAHEMGAGYGIGGRVQGGTTVTLTQNISSPKALSQYDIWRQTKNMLQTVKLQGV